MVIKPLKSSLTDKMRIVARKVGENTVVTAQPSLHARGYSFGSVNISKRGLIFNFGVNPSFRQYGVGKRLFRAAINRPDLPARLRLYARAEPGGMPQDKLEAFYESFGFRPTGLVNQYGKQMVLNRDSTAVAAARP